MKMHLLHGRENGKVLKLRAPGGGEAGNESEGLKNDLQAFRDSIRAAAEKPDEFWSKQRAGILGKLEGPVSVPGRKPALLWVPAAIVILLSLFFFVEKSKAPTPDFAAGSDQILLIEVERALIRECPEALAPAALITREIERAGETTEHPVAKE